MQTELRLRLIKDGKIVEYEERKMLDGHFLELGVKVGDDWWFEGDKVETLRALGRLFSGVLCFDKYGWFITEKSGTMHCMGGGAIHWDELKLIGNIHEEE